ncbi:hypothetical protein LK996_02795 [Lysobacter sp. A6]|uniref:Uncharacterized protein n=1 Tax=Noviluteimonas lactosilytica TaxID=2888523 RepID=A0ABS8JEH6_9GAMM|nr:hypothetical protein [Lysobacter lactosilyticus]MCC8362013.1 hypothetical protein [Lysobacter lactosilyticus]
MSTHDDNASDTGLTPEERALARRLSKIGPQGEPSAALDSHILAAAHAAVRPTVAPRRKVSKWPATLGFAASLAIACGIAWQLHPVPEAPREATQVLEHDEGVEYRAPPPMRARPVAPRALNMPTPPPAEEAAAPRQRARIRSATPADAQRKPQAFAIEGPVVLDEAVHPAPPAAMAAPAAPPPPSPPMQAMERADAAAQSARQRAEPEFAEADEEVVPPATTESPAVRDAWLQRIRELVRDGHADAARESLKAFRDRYPGHAIPDDLRALEE